MRDRGQKMRGEKIEFLTMKVTFSKNRGREKKKRESGREGDKDRVGERQRQGVRDAGDEGGGLGGDEAAYSLLTRVFYSHARKVIPHGYLAPSRHR